MFPTDTIYGIAASIAKESGVDKIYDVKSRSRDKPIMIYVTCLEQFRQIAVGVCEKTIGSLRNIWPGAMAGIFLKNDDVVPDYVTSGKKNGGSAHSRPYVLFGSGGTGGASGCCDKRKCFRDGDA